MREPWEDDPDNLWTIAASHNIAQTMRATELVGRALAALAEGYPGNPRVHALRVKREGRVMSALAGQRDMIVAIVGEWQSAEEHLLSRGEAPTSAVMAEAAAEAKRLADEVAAMDRRLSRVPVALAYSAANGTGEDLAETMDTAVEHLREAFQSLLAARAALNRAATIAPGNARGAGGALSRLRLAPDLAMARKLAMIWIVNRLTLSGGDQGDGLDVFLAAMLGRPDRKRVEELMADVRREISDRMSTENSPSELH